MLREQAILRRKTGGAVFAMIFCAAVGAGLLLGARVAPVRAQQSKVGEQAENQVPEERSPFYCNTKSLSKEEWAHKGQISEKMRSARVEIKELPNGYAFRYQPGGVSLMELADWVESEARCCPFFDMGIRVEHEGGPVWLTLTGNEGVKQFIRSEFKLQGVK